MDTLSTTNNFGYNARSELASALMGTNTYGYVYDPIGNRLTATNNTEVLHYGANELNQYTNITDGVTLTPLFDADGNLTNDSQRAYTWDAENRLLTVEPLSPTNGAQRVVCTYDYMSRRVSKIAETWNGSTWGNTETNTFVYDGWNLLQETRASTSTIINSYTWGLDLSQSLQGAGGIGGLLMANLDGTTVFYYHDGNGNVTELTGTDGNVVAHYEYSPFGETTAKTGVFADANPFRFSAKYTDSENGLVYYGYRYYQPGSGRWLSRDPIYERGGINLYCLVSNTAITAFDLLGLAADPTYWYTASSAASFRTWYKGLWTTTPTVGSPEEAWENSLIDSAEKLYSHFITEAGAALVEAVKNIAVCATIRYDLAFSNASSGTYSMKIYSIDFVELPLPGAPIISPCVIV